MIRYMASNFLSANPLKTGFLLIRRKQSDVRRKIIVGKDQVEEQTSHRILGLTVNNSLTWKDHANGVLNSVYQRIGALRRVTYHVPSESLPSITSAIVASKIRYGIAVYGGLRLNDADPTSESDKALQIALNEAMRVATKSHRRDRVPITELIQRMGIQSVNRMSAEDKLRLAWQVTHYPNSPLNAAICRPSKNKSEITLRSSTRGDLQAEAREEFSGARHPNLEYSHGEYPGGYIVVFIEERNKEIRQCSPFISFQPL